MKNKNQQFLNKIYDSSFQTVGNVLADFIDYLESFAEEGSIEPNSIDLKYRLNRYYRALCVYKYEPEMVELTARKMFRSNYSYKDDFYNVVIEVNDLGIVLTINEKEHGDYLKTNAFLFSKTRGIYFDFKYTVRFNVSDGTGYKDAYDVGDVFKDCFTNDYLDSINDLVITKEDQNIYDFFKNCKNEKMVKQLLNDLVDFYSFCNGNSGIQDGHLTLEKYRDKVLDNKSKMN